MHIEGRRIHIVGSASPDTPSDQLRYAHSLLAAIVEALARRDVRFVVGVGKEPPAANGDPSSPSVIFDWTMLETLNALIQQGVVQPHGPFGQLVATLATNKTTEQVPEARNNLWQTLCRSDAVHLTVIEPGWAAGSIRRARQSRMGDVLIALSGGEGVEHLVQLYAQAGKPVIPLDLNMGSSTGDGSGGASRLAARALANPDRYFCSKDPAAAGVLLANLSTRNGTRPVSDVSNALIHLLDSIADPTAFYVRLLDPSAEEYAVVEHFFRCVIDPVVTEFGFSKIEMSRSSTQHAWINDGIFDSLHHSQLVIVDLTASRPNCLMELGYALGRQLPVLITVLAGTKVPFDAQMLDYYAWAATTDDDERKAGFRDYWHRNIDRPVLVRPREVL